MESSLQFIVTSPDHDEKNELQHVKCDSIHKRKRYVEN